MINLRDLYSHELLLSNNYYGYLKILLEFKIRNTINKNCVQIP